jgi:hypothetical protein
MGLRAAREETARVMLEVGEGWLVSGAPRAREEARDEHALDLAEQTYRRLLASFTQTDLDGWGSARRSPSCATHAPRSCSCGTTGADAPPPSTRRTRAARRPNARAGSCGGYFRTGRFVDCGGMYSNSFLTTLMNAMGIQGDTFGEVSAAPLPNMT